MVKFSKKLYRALREILVALNVLKLYIEGAIPKVMRNLKSKYKNMALTNLKILKFRSIRCWWYNFFLTLMAWPRFFSLRFGLFPFWQAGISCARFLENECCKGGKVTKPQGCAGYAGGKNREVWKRPMSPDRYESPRSLPRVREMSCHLKHRWL